MGKPGRSVAESSPAELIASRISGNSVAGTIAAGWRRVRTIERRASSPIWSRRGGCERAGAARRPTVAAVKPLLPLSRAAPSATASSRASSSAAAPSSERPVLARKTSLRLGACRSMLAITSPSSSKARTIAASVSGPLSRRTAAPLGEAGTSSPKRSSTWAARSRSPRSAGTASTVGRPTSALSAAGVPSATILPWSMIPTRSASWSASSRYWVVRKTVMPSSRERLATSSQSAVRLWMSSPVVGSSRKRTRGAVQQRQRQVEPALHAAGVAAHLAVGGVGEADPLDQLVARAWCARPWRGRAARPGAACARARSAAGRAPPPGGRRRSRRGRGRPGSATSKPATRRGTRGGRQQRGQHVDGGGLAGAVGAEEAVDLAGADLDVDAVDGADAALELAGQTRRLDAVVRSPSTVRLSSCSGPPMLAVEVVADYGRQSSTIFEYHNC